MASTLLSASVNGAPDGAPNGAARVPKSKRFSDIPSTIDIPVQDQDDEAVEIDLEELADDPTELCTLFEMEHAARTYWMTVALAYAKQKKVDFAIEMLIRGANAMQANQREKLSIITCLCWMYLWKSREAPRVPPDGMSTSEAKTKEYYLQLATQSLNEASRINPAFPPLFLARGVLILLRASLQSPSRTAGAVDPHKAEQLRSALKSFEEAIRVSQGKNMLAVMGKARALFSLGRFSESLAAYQEVLAKMPDMVDPDPRIGIGCCFWQLGYKDDAKIAWERCLEINPDSKHANILLGLYYLDASGHVPTNSPEFIRLYKKAMTEYTQKSFKLDKNLPLTCATFAGYFLSRKQFANVDALANKAIQYTDVNAIASDGWYLLARKEHYAGNLDRASDYYRRADDARGGAERGFLPAKFGIAQLSVLKNDLGEAKLRLEKIIQQSKSYEAMVLLGTLYAEEVFANQAAAVKEDKTAEAKKAIGLLEAVRSAWKDPKKNLPPDAAVLLNLARLYESEHPDKALQCLQQVEQLEMEQIPQSEYPADAQDEAAVRAALRKLLPPQLLNNIGCFYSQDGKHSLATELFQAALDSCVRISQSESDVDTDALLTTISFNLGRSYEYEGDVDKAIETYEQLLSRHNDYTDARARLAYIRLRRNPNNKEGPDGVAKLYQENPSDLEVRALYGWFLGKVNSKKRPANMAEDPEQRHFKHTLQNYDKHDRYALVGMGNLHLVTAREMRRETEQDKLKRSAAYSRAVEFFDKALQLDPKNAYAAQGIAIALVEDKKDYKNALQIFIKVRETIQDAHVYVNLGHIYAELRQFTKAIESYEIALSKEGKANDPVILSCLGRTWLNKGRAERNLDAYKMALEYAEKVRQMWWPRWRFLTTSRERSLTIPAGALHRSRADPLQVQRGLRPDPTRHDHQLDARQRTHLVPARAGGRGPRGRHQGPRRDRRLAPAAIPEARHRAARQHGPQHAAQAAGARPGQPARVRGQEQGEASGGARAAAGLPAPPRGGAPQGRGGGARAPGEDPPRARGDPRPRPRPGRAARRGGAPARRGRADHRQRDGREGQAQEEGGPRPRPRPRLALRRAPRQGRPVPAQEGGARLGRRGRRRRRRVARPPPAQAPAPQRRRQRQEGVDQVQVGRDCRRQQRRRRRRCRCRGRRRC